MPIYYIGKYLKEVFREAEHPNKDSLKIMVHILFLLQQEIFKPFYLDEISHSERTQGEFLGIYTPSKIEEK